MYETNFFWQMATKSVTSQALTARDVSVNAFCSVTLRFGGGAAVTHISIKVTHYEH